MRAVTMNGSVAARFWAATVALAIVLAACGSDDGGGEGDTEDDGGSDESSSAVLSGDVDVVTSDDDPVPGGRLVYGLSAETDGWNPTLSRWAPSGVQVAWAIFDPLVVVDADGEWQPNALESIEPNGDFTEWRMRPRAGVAFHNGKPLDAEAVRAHLQFIADSPLTEVIMEPVESFSVDGEEVVITTRGPWTTFPYVLSSQIGFVADAEWLETRTPDNPVGTGPFVYTSWTPGDRLIVERNPDYWQEGLPYLEEVEFRPIPDGSARSRALRDGELRVIQVTDAPELRAWRTEAETGPYQYLDSHDMEMPEAFVMLNLAEPPFDDPDARRALALATDREQFLELIDAGDVFEVADGPWAPSSPWYSEVDYPDHDPDAARALVEEVKERTGSFSFTIETTPTPGSQRANQALIESWQAVGIDVTVDSQSQEDLVPKVLFGNYQAVFWRQFDFSHPANETIWWSPIASGGEWYPFDHDTPEPPEYGLNFARIRDQELQDLITEGRSLETREEQRELFGTINEKFAELVPYIWLYHTRDAVVARDDVVNIDRWFTPDGEPGIRFMQGTHPVAQIWLRR